MPHPQYVRQHVCVSHVSSTLRIVSSGNWTTRRGMNDSSTTTSTTPSTPAASSHVRPIHHCQRATGRSLVSNERCTRSARPNMHASIDERFNVVPLFVFFFIFVQLLSQLRRSKGRVLRVLIVRDQFGWPCTQCDYHIMSNDGIRLEDDDIRYVE